ncbi:N-formylglutamate deformylase (plasmid) [Aminobacter sp. MSH1]|uniref:N-formylglutamate deformylase n=1 Tax=Aminobacter sp. MSH1 TaxID=374606 RepID=UPI000D3A6B97|nr:N-formylglutamate deformylase [Aminobacter sp. MSH1]AWC25833.1 N-formylglutamate deformylase [Aminobacter sp. MSH1]
MGEAALCGGGDWLEVVEGNLPFIVSLPHTGTTVPDEFAAGFANTKLTTRDADWHLHQVFRPILPAGTTVVRTDISRSIIDVNRPPDGQSLYPGQATTGLCPTTDFDGTPLYRSGSEPAPDEIERRRRLFHEPYARALGEQIERLRARHGRVAVLDCHSIRPRIPRLFDGTLPGLNIGTDDGRSCSPRMQAKLEAVAEQSPFTWVSNGRFKGGWITRHFGNPKAGIDSVQIEIAMNAYLLVRDENDYGAPEYEADGARLLQQTLSPFIEALLQP